MSDEGDGWSTWPAPAKLNVFLQITGRRADGYHELQTVFQLLDWGDEIRLRVRTDGRIERSRGAAGVPAEDDLAVRAARLLQQCSGSRLGADIAVDKQIPVGGGFGGGSSNAATVLCALDQLWATGLGRNRLAALGLQLGADVPVFLHGCSAWAEGVGDRLTPITLPQRWYVLLDPGVHASTAELFQAPDLTRNANPLKMADFDFDTRGGNAFETVLRCRVPRVDAALVALAQFGKAALTGTGSGCFAEFVTRASANEAAAALAGQGWSVWVAAGVARSSLLDRLVAEATPDAVERHVTKR